MDTITGIVTKVIRHGHTVNGNPTMSVTIQSSEGWSTHAPLRISSDAILVYAIENSEFRNEPHTFALTRAGRISHVVREVQS